MTKKKTEDVTEDVTEDKPKRPVLTLADLWTWYRVRFTFLTQICRVVRVNTSVDPSPA